MVLKIYGLMWLLGFLAVGITYLTGNLNSFMTILFGFLSFGATFMGMIAVLPLTVAPHSHSKH